MIIDQIFVKPRFKSETSPAHSLNEKPLRSIIKSISWRVIGTLDTVLISWFITGTLTLALSIGAIELITKMVLYFAHERLWNTIKWGK